MNTQHLQYIIEIERTRSISQAAENLFLGQPNLSRILHDLEESLGFRIFERTSRGVRPTERGARFLKHARNMLREMDYIEALGPRHAVPNRLRVCIPRSAKLLDATAGYLASLPEASDLDARIFECHARRALEILSAGEESEALVTLREGKFHQVKRMLAARGAPVTYLRRVRMGNLTLDPALQPGEYRFLTPEERKILGAEAE